jgi:hypothetical protein
MILGLLENAGVSWAVYDLGQDHVDAGQSDNVFLFWKRFADDPRAPDIGRLPNDAEMGRLPQVSFIIPSFTLEQDEHPPGDITIGMSDLTQCFVLSCRRSWNPSGVVSCLGRDRCSG